METDPAWPDGGTFSGEDARKFVVSFSEPFERIEAVTGELVEIGPHLVSDARWVGKGLSSGAESTLEFTIVWSFDDHGIAKLVTFFDHDEAFESARSG